MDKKYFFIISVVFLFFYLPIIIHPNLILNRNNDLQEVFWPMFSFVKRELLIHHQLPLWNSLWFAGSPLLPDPQFSIFYPPHWLFIFVPIGTAFMINFLGHILLGGIGIYLVSKNIFKFSSMTSLFTALLFILSPKLAGYLEAGHLGLLESTTWIPFIIFTNLMLVKKPQKKWAIFLSISLAATFFTHTIIFLISLIVSSLLYFITILLFSKKNLLTKTPLLILTLFFTFGLTAITLLPQLEWSKSTTRFLLLEQRQTFPQWNSKGEVVQDILLPWFKGIKTLQQIDSEKWLSLGFLTTILAFIGFLRLNRKLKITVSITLTTVFLIILNNASPIYPILIKQDWFALMRISTRPWLIILFIAIFLAGLGIELITKFSKKLALFLIIAAVAESGFLSGSYLNKPISQPKFAPTEIYQFLKSDHSLFRIFCTTSCLSQQQAAEDGLELVEGYNTIQQRNFYQEAWQLTGGFWNYYTLSIPPIGTLTFEKNQPDAKYLGLFNTKYVISPYKLTSLDFTLIKQIGDYYIYQDNLFFTRAFYSNSNDRLENAVISFYSPNIVRINIPQQVVKGVILSQVYSTNWKAYLNGQTEVKVQERPDTLMMTNIEEPDTNFVEFRYEPQSFKIGAVVTLITLTAIVVILLR